MRSLFCFFSLLLFFGTAGAQTYADSIEQYRKKYIEDLMAEPRKPVQPSQVKFINFYPPDPAYRVLAQFIASPGSVPFQVQTHSGKQKPFREYGVVVFKLNGEMLTLHVYQSMDLVRNSAHKDDLFIPFNDMTNYDGTYPGGRYLDLTVQDIVDNKVLLDFNKCYNPYCAYSEGFSCPIPPRENSLRAEIKAGEKMFFH